MLLKSLCYLPFLVFSLSLQARQIDFTWQGSPEAAGYEIQVAKIKDFKKLVTKKRTTQPQIKFNLAMGQYYYRVRAFDQKKRPGIWSKPVLLNVAPYPPKPVSPKKGAKFNFYEERNLIEFRWDKLDGEVQYELLVQKTDGKTILEKKMTKTRYPINDFAAGDYVWKVRAIVGDNLITQYSEPRFFFITQTPVEPPVLVSPKDKAFLASYREGDFVWEKDPVTKYTDIELERLDKKEKLIKLTNLEGERSEMPMLLAGKYRWRVITKETKDSPGTSSEWAEFTSSSAVLSSDNHIFRIGFGVQSLAYNIESTRAGGITEATQQAAYFVNLYNRLQITKSFGLAFELQELSFKIDETSRDFATNTILTEFRFGKDDFQQVSFLGYRQMDQYDRISGSFEQLSTLGIVMGIGMDGYLNSNNKLRLSMLYFKPNELLQKGGELTADMYEIRFAYSHNLTERIWIDWEFAYDKVIFKLEDNSGGISRWNYEAIAPINLKLSYEY